jgi:hypothetical protein
MIILVGSKIAQSAIQTSLGKPEYSYFFLLKSFMPALQRLGQVISVTSTEEVDEQYALHRAAGRDVVFLSFSPPHQTPVGLKCPTVCVFAWEFCSIPLASDRTRMLLPDDWGAVFSRIAGVIATSREAAALVSEHASLPVAAIPAPVWGLFEDQHDCAERGRRLTLQGEVIDSRKLKLDPEQAISQPESEAVRISRAMWRGWSQEVRLPRRRPGALPRHKSSSVDFEGVVYTSVLNPKDGRKNWVEMMTAFCWAFRDVEDATLLLKMTHHDIEQFRGDLIKRLSRLMPFRCRVVALHGFLDETQYRQLIEVSDYYVNASKGEGLCLPLMEFLCCGRPAIAPMHTAMADYLRSEYCFPVASSPESDCWPHDPVGRMLTLSRRLNWQSLVEAFRDSYQQARNREQYLAASRAAKAFMKDFCAPEVVAAQIAELIERARQGNTASQAGGSLQA